MIEIEKYDYQIRPASDLEGHTPRARLEFVCTGTISEVERLVTVITSMIDPREWNEKKGTGCQRACV